MTDSLINKLNPFLQQAWEKSEFQEPTTVQAKAIPAALAGKDVIAESPTGTGKTLAYLLPVLQKVEVDLKAVQAVIIAPSQELVMQILDEIQKWAEGSGIRAASFIGGANVKRQLEKLKKHPHIAIGTPGRILELTKQKKLKMHEVRTVVLDEVDQLFIPEHLDTLKSIVKSTLSERQMLMVSATLPPVVEKLAKELSNNLEVIKVEEDETINASTVDHIYFIVEQREKMKMLEKIARLELKTLVFVKDIGNLTVMSEKLQFKNIHTSSLHSELKKTERQNALKDFRKGKTNLLLATDVAARGLDIKDVASVVHFDFPKDLKQYVHRSGRTGRFGASGTVISLVTEREERELKKFTKELGILAVKKIMRGGKIIDPQ